MHQLADTCVVEKVSFTPADQVWQPGRQQLVPQAWGVGSMPAHACVVTCGLHPAVSPQQDSP